MPFDLHSPLQILLPFKEEDEDDNADDEDDSQHWPNHPQKPLLLVYDWLRLNIGEKHGIREWTCGVHSLSFKDQTDTAY